MLLTFTVVTVNANAANIPPYFLKNLSIKDFIISLPFTIIVIFTPLSYHINIYKGKAMVRIMVFLGTKKSSARIGTAIFFMIFSLHYIKLLLQHTCHQQCCSGVFHCIFTTMSLHLSIRIHVFLDHHICYLYLQMYFLFLLLSCLLNNLCQY